MTLYIIYKLGVQSYEYYHYNRQESKKLIREADIFFVANRQYITDFQ